MIGERIDIARLKELENSGHLRSQTHPTEELIIWNYTQDCQVEGAWDEITIACRGLITDFQGNVVSRPIPKFFNHFQEQAKEVNTNQPFVCYEKLDCYLGVSYWVGEKMFIASRGSFDSIYSVEANKILDRMVSSGELDLSKLDRSMTYVFEVIITKWPIVVRYDEDRLVLLAVIESKTGKEHDVEKISGLNFDLPKIYEFSTWENVLNSKQRKNEEGYVAKFQDGSRLKFKFLEYMLLHGTFNKLIAYNERDIWRALRDNTFDEFVEEIPDEYYPAVKKYKDKFLALYNEKCKEFFADVESIGMDFNMSKKDFAEAVKLLKREHQKHAFSFYNCNRGWFREGIYNMFEPSFPEKLFQDLEQLVIKKLVMLQGIPGSGKSTEARRLQRIYGYDRVNKDDIRAMLFHPQGQQNEMQVIAVRNAIIRNSLSLGKGIIVDDTNLNPVHEIELREIAEHYGAEFQIVRMETPVEECIDRNSKRNETTRVGEDSMEKMIEDLKNYDENLKKIQQDMQQEETIQFRANLDPSLPEAIIVDIDGTLAHMNKKRGPYEYHKVDVDDPDHTIRDIVKMECSHGTRIIVMSGRDEVCREMTEKWLRDHGIPYHDLRMRKLKDQRKDRIVKLELYQEHVDGQYRVKYTLDDRDQVVELWRSIGLKCLQVEYGNF